MLKIKRNYFTEASGEGAGDAGSGGAVDTPAGTTEAQEKPDTSKSLSGLLDPPADSKEGEQNSESGKEEKQEEAKPVVPEKYEITAPEGFDGIDEALLNDFTTLAKEAGISNEQAQKLADLYSKQLMAQAEAQEQQWFKQREEWVNELKRDPEFGNGNEETFRGNVGKAQLALEQFGTPELKQYLLDTGLGDNTHVLKLMAKVGNALGEDSLVVGGASGAGKRAADILFDGR